MNAEQLIKQNIKAQDTPKKRINALAKEYAKVRAGIQASEKDITSRDMFEALFEYLKQLELVIEMQGKAIKNDSRPTTPV